MSPTYSVPQLKAVRIPASQDCDTNMTKVFVIYYQVYRPYPHKRNAPQKKNQISKSILQKGCSIKCPLLDRTSFSCQAWSSFLWKECRKYYGRKQEEQSPPSWVVPVIDLSWYLRASWIHPLSTVPLSCCHFLKNHSTHCQKTETLERPLVPDLVNAWIGQITTDQCTQMI